MINVEELARQQGLPDGSLDFVASDLPEWSSGFTGRVRVIMDFRDRDDDEQTWGAHLPKIPRGKILDAGCSRGDTTFEIARLYPDCRVVGVDSDPSRIERAEEIKSIIPIVDLSSEKFHDAMKRSSFLVANFYRIGKYFKPSTFTGIFAMNNLSYVAREIDLLGHAIIAEGFFGVLKEGGYLCFSGGDTEVHACAVFRKGKKDFEPVYANDNFREKGRFGHWAEAYGLKTT